MFDDNSKNSVDEVGSMNQNLHKSANFSLAVLR